MSKVISKNRLLAFNKQESRCYYCDVPMWLEKKREFAVNHEISERQAKRLQCTAEHLLARQDGGTNARKNIVAACSFCNMTRHRALKALPSIEFQKKVMRRMRRQKWHPREFHQIL